MSDPKTPAWGIPDLSIADPLAPVPHDLPSHVTEAIAKAGAAAEPAQDVDADVERTEFQALLDFIAANKDADTEVIAADADDFGSPVASSNKE